MKFKQYLNEGRTKSLTVEKTIDLIKKNALKTFKGMFIDHKYHIIYRGNSGVRNDFGFVDTSQGIDRVSANTANYMTLLIDNLPSWKGWPKRSRGIICSTDRNYASGYGMPFYVVPFDNDSKIGICDNEDLWLSFDNALSGEMVDDFNAYLGIMFEGYKIKEPTTWTELKKSLETIDVNIKNNVTFKSYSTDSLNEYGFFNQNKNIIDTLNKELSPKNNNFKMGLDKLTSNKEVWIEGKVILLSEKGIKMIMDDYKENKW